MLMRRRLFPMALLLIALPLLWRTPQAATASGGGPPLVYTLSFPAPQARWMQVEVEIPAVTGTLRLRMSRASPGRYTLHEFAKNVYDVLSLDDEGRPLPVAHLSPNAWSAEGNGGAIRVRYRIFGDRVDGTYLAIDDTHAHINGPAALMWAEGRELDPVTVRIEPPSGLRWSVATQLFPTDDPLVFSAPNLHYLMDSPIEISAHERHTFVADMPAGAPAGAAPTIVVALHQPAPAARLDAFLSALRLIVREQAAVFGEYPAFDRDTYTFIADVLPWANADGMEHLNSTVLTQSVSIDADAESLLTGASHEFFHAWNVERIRPQSLEPFNLLDINVSGELWLAEGFTTYYETLAMLRAGVIPLDSALREFGGRISQVLTSRALRYRSADEMSRMALLWDRAVRADRTNLDETFLSYYVHGAAIAMGFDLALRARSGGQHSLDDFMRALWRTHGRPESEVPGRVLRPYTLDDVRAGLAAISDEGFARELLSRYVFGRDAMDYERLVTQAGLRLQPVAPGAATLGALSLEDAGGRVRLSAPAPHGSAAEAAGLAEDDAILMLGNRVVRHAGDLESALAAHRAGDEVTVRFQRRSEAQPRHATVKLDERSGFELVAIEAAGGTLDEQARAFRAAWLGSRFRGETCR
jgi:predicted metalloprotease with PDZ domain